jgi:serpin B
MGKVQLELRETRFMKSTTSPVQSAPRETANPDLVAQGKNRWKNWPSASVGSRMTMGLLSRLVFVTLFMTTLIGHTADTTAANDIESVAGGNTAFALNLYARLKTADGNLFFSPYSISTCLAMTYAGARGDTAAQMAQTLHFDPNQNQLAASFGELQTQLNTEQKKKGIELDIANGLWAQKDQPFLPAFLDVAKQSYGANLKQVDFRTHADIARTEINDWVDHKTKGKITGLIQPGVLGPATRLVLVNAIYFNGSWAREFDKHSTTKAPFTVTPQQKPEVPLMDLTADFKNAEVDGLQLLELPYAGDDLSMIVLLPRELDGLKGVEDLLNTQTLDRWLAQAREQKVAVSLPKFKLSAQFSLAKPLAEMGMTDAFSPSANFSGVDGERDLFISAVVHKAFVDVNEEGTEAAAATGVVMRMTAVMMPRPMPIFRADHPFIFLIRDNHSGSIFFLGRLVDPTRP